MIVIINYGMGNLGSIVNMLKNIGAQAMISSDVPVIQGADKLILPGVGSFDNGMENLNKLGLVPALNKKVCEDKTPILGICLGMQLFTKRSEEGQLAGLGWIDADTVRFRSDGMSKDLKVPHMGWNHVRTCRSHPVLEDMETEPRFYFAHSYHLVCEDADMIGATGYGYEFPSAVAKRNITGVQFHPEKSHKFGMKLLDNFVRRA